jgi:hypothetical protein
MADVEAAVARLNKIGVKDVESLSIAAAKALADLSDDQLKALVKATESVKGKVRPMDGNFIF